MLLQVNLANNIESLANNVGIIIGILGIVLAFVSIFISVYYGVRSKKFEEQVDLLRKKNDELATFRKTLFFEDLKTSAIDIRKSVAQAGFTPEVIFTPGLRGATFANVLEDEFHEDSIPVIVGITFWDKSKMLSDTTGFHLIDDTLWSLLIPNALFKLKDKKVLIVDDFAKDGRFMEILIKKLMKLGFPKKNIKTTIVAITKVTETNGNKPDFHWYVTFDDNFYFPWGRAK